MVKQCKSTGISMKVSDTEMRCETAIITSFAFHAGINEQWQVLMDKKEYSNKILGNGSFMGHPVLGSWYPKDAT
jgi:hypothetical protein